MTSARDLKIATKDTFEEISKENLVRQLGRTNSKLVTEILHRFSYIPPDKLTALAALALPESWGKNHYALKTYLAANLVWSLDQNRFTSNDNQLYLTAGHLQTRYGTPIYLAFERNKNLGKEPWYLRFVGANLEAPEFPSPPSIPQITANLKGMEIVIAHDHILEDSPERISFLDKTPIVARLCALSGAIQWSINRDLQLPYWYFGTMKFLVPIYLQSRENITQAPDLIAPVEIRQDGKLNVRTVLEPHMPYAKARVAVMRHDQLPPWMLDAWNDHAEQMSEVDVEGQETE